MEIRLKRGNKANLPLSATLGEPLLVQDEQALYMGTGTGIQKIGDAEFVATKADLPTSGIDTKVYVVKADESQGNKSTMYRWASELTTPAYELVGNAEVSFLELTDSPSDYTGNAGFAIRVNSTENGIEFFDPATQAELDSEITNRQNADTAIRNDFGSTATGNGASLVGVEDAGANFTGTNVEDVLAEIDGALDTEVTDRTNADQAIRNDLASTATGLGASTVGIEDAGANFTATDVENALKELSDEKADLAGATFSGNISIPDPSADGHGANKKYVDSIAQGLKPKDQAKVATTVNEADIDIDNAPLSIDGISLAVGDRVVVKDNAFSSVAGETSTGSSAIRNGIYEVTVVKDTNADGVNDATELARTTDADSASELEGAYIFVAQGTDNSDQGFYQRTDGVTVGTSNLEFVRFTGAGKISAGAGLGKSADTISANVDGVSIEVDANDNLSVKAGGVGASELASGSVTNAKLATEVDNRIVADNIDETGLSDGMTLQYDGTNLKWVVSNVVDGGSF